LKTERLPDSPAGPTLSDQVTAAELAAVVAECARIAGLDVTLTPLPHVDVRMGKAQMPRGTAPDDPAAYETITCKGVALGRDYVVARLPEGRWVALKVDFEGGHVLLRLKIHPEFRPLLFAVFQALVWDRLKSGQEKFQPRIDQMPVRERTVLTADRQLAAVKSPQASPPVFVAKKKMPKPVPVVPQEAAPAPSVPAPVAAGPSPSRSPSTAPGAVLAPSKPGPPLSGKLRARGDGGPR
jgi:hypothetical protein